MEQQVWQQHIKGTHIYQVVRKLQVLKNPLRQLHGQHFSNVAGQVVLARARLSHIQQNLIGQKSKVDWLSMGDQNSQIFHAVVCARRAQTKINCLVDSMDVRLINKDHIFNDVPLLGTKRGVQKLGELSSPINKALGPDRFSSLFLRKPGILLEETYRAV
ncbi:hypothetical protein Ancab_013020 [Ancistrocladus abbreviatus]